jgi:hypothetical protein
MDCPFLGKVDKGIAGVRTAIIFSESLNCDEALQASWVESRDREDHWPWVRSCPGPRYPASFCKGDIIHQM